MREREIEPITGATLYAVSGTPRRSGRFLFVPVLLDLDGSSRGVPLAPAEGTDCPAVLRAVHDRLAYDVPENLFLSLWVRSRLPGVFGFAPAGAGNTRKIRLLDVGFVAVADGTATPFVCLDGECEPLLEFDPGVPPADRRAIADALWDLFAADPFGVRPFRDHCGDALAAEDDPPDVLGLDAAGYFAEGMGPNNRFDPHLGFLTGESRPCPECGGSGEESFCPAGDTCEVCGGTGEVSWPATGKRRRPRATNRTRPRE
jgi:hypothetical protein